MKPPLECALCGAAKWNDESVTWIEMSWGERVPYCTGYCANRANPNTCSHEDHLALCRRCADSDARERGRQI